MGSPSLPKLFRTNNYCKKNMLDSQPLENIKDTAPSTRHINVSF
jgi:hypothetical protein